jgi:hypothetical protein
LTIRKRIVYSPNAAPAAFLLEAMEGKTSAEMITKRRLLIGCGLLMVLCVAAVVLPAYLLIHRVEGQYFVSNAVRRRFASTRDIRKRLSRWIKMQGRLAIDLDAA